MHAKDALKNTLVFGTATLFLIAMLMFGMSEGAAAQSAPSTGPSTGQYSKRPDSKRSWPSHSYPKQPIEVRTCSCLYAGEGIPIGQTICMKFEGKRVLATCDTVVNSPSWSISSVTCPST